MGVPLFDFLTTDFLALRLAGVDALPLPARRAVAFCLVFDRCADAVAARGAATQLRTVRRIPFERTTREVQRLPPMVALRRAALRRAALTALRDGRRTTKT